MSFLGGILDRGASCRRRPRPSTGTATRTIGATAQQCLDQQRIRTSIKQARGVRASGLSALIQAQLCIVRAAAMRDTE
eukprot:10167430-Alexandrium_andersonii.AAC.1